MNDHAPWTVILYMAAGRDVEVQAREDLAEVRAGAAESGARVYLLHDGIEGCRREIWEGGRRRLELLRQDVNIGDPDSLARALREAEGALPSPRRALVMWGHATGWVGRSTPSDQLPLEQRPQVAGWGPAEVMDRPDALVMPDPQTGDWLDTGELREGLAVGRGDRPLDLLALDACHMAGVELLARVAPHAALVVASADRMSAGAWAYDELVRSLAAPGATAEGAAELIVRGYRRAMTGDRAPRSLVAVRPERLVGVMQRLDVLGEALLKAGDWGHRRLPSAIAQAAVRPYGERGYYGHDVADLPKVLERAQVPAPELALAREVVAAAGCACVTRWVSGDPSARLGLSLFLGAEGGLPEEYTDVVPAEGGWLRFLRTAWGVGGEGAPPA